MSSSNLSSDDEDPVIKYNAGKPPKTSTFLQRGTTPSPQVRINPKNNAALDKRPPSPFSALNNGGRGQQNPTSSPLSSSSPKDARKASQQTSRPSSALSSSSTNNNGPRSTTMLSTSVKNISLNELNASWRPPQASSTFLSKKAVEEEMQRQMLIQQQQQQEVRRRPSSGLTLIQQQKKEKDAEAARVSAATTAANILGVVVMPTPLPRPLREPAIQVSADGTHIPTTAATGQSPLKAFQSGVCRSALVVPVADDIQAYGLAHSSIACYNGGDGGGGASAGACLRGGDDDDGYIYEDAGGGGDDAAEEKAFGTGGVYRSRPASSLMGPMTNAQQRSPGSPPSSSPANSPSAQSKKIGPHAMAVANSTSRISSAAHQRTDSPTRNYQPTTNANHVFAGRPISAMARFPRCATDSIRPHSSSAAGKTKSVKKDNSNNNSAHQGFFGSRPQSAASLLSSSYAVGASRVTLLGERGGSPSAAEEKGNTIVLVDAFGRLVNPVASSNAAPLVSSSFAITSSSEQQQPSVVKDFLQGVTSTTTTSMHAAGAANGSSAVNVSTTSSAPFSGYGKTNVSRQDDHQHANASPSSSVAVASLYQRALNAVEQNTVLTNERDVRVRGSAIGGGMEGPADGDSSHALRRMKRSTNGWFDVNRRPASALRRGHTLWGRVGDAPAISLLHSKPVDQSNAASVALVKHRQLLTEPIRSRVPHAVKGGLKTTSSSITLMQGAVRRGRGMLAGGGVSVASSAAGSDDDEDDTYNGYFSRTNSSTTPHNKGAAGGSSSPHRHYNSQLTSSAQRSQLHNKNGAKRTFSVTDSASGVDGNYYDHSATTAELLSAMDAMEVNRLDDWVPSKSLGEEVANAVTAMWSGKKQQPFFHPSETPAGGGGRSAAATSVGNEKISGGAQKSPTRKKSRRSRFDGADLLSTSGGSSDNEQSSPSRLSTYAAAKALPMTSSRTHTIDPYAYDDDSSSGSEDEEARAAAAYNEAINNISIRTRDSSGGGMTRKAAASTAGSIATQFAGVAASSPNRKGSSPTGQTSPPTLSHDPVANASHYRSIISGPVGLPTYRTSRFSEHASVSWDMVMEVPLEVTQRILEERSRFEKW